ncbi:hypothetical protein HY251_17170 [bacterium]|nr:hypothetical protein [bacterium]
MRHPNWLLGSFLAAATSLAACGAEQGRFTVISTRNVELSRVDLKHIPLKRGVSGSDGRFWFLFIPFGGAPTINNAIDDCLKSGDGDFMVSTRVKSFGWTILLFSWESFSAHGDVGSSLGSGSREVTPMPDAPPPDRGGVEHN